MYILDGRDRHGKCKSNANNTQNNAKLSKHRTIRHPDSMYANIDILTFMKFLTLSPASLLFQSRLSSILRSRNALIRMANILVLLTNGLYLATGARFINQTYIVFI